MNYSDNLTPNNNKTHLLGVVLIESYLGIARACLGLQPPIDKCKQAKELMKQKNDSELGSFKNAVTCGDAAWLTRGYHSQNATYTLRNYQISGLLYYKHFSQRDKDDITREELFKGTSKSAEGFGAEWVFRKLYLMK
uniref:Uncharacterized protein n=1 Tax=Amphimedon queenslandica TaxID=400682 RepID=A0A1X7ST43_AMPQE